MAPETRRRIPMTRSGPSLLLIAMLAQSVISGSRADGKHGEVLFADTFGTDSVPAMAGWRPQGEMFPTRVVAADCPDGGPWALQLKTNTSEFPGSRIDSYHTVPGVEDGDSLQLEAWVRVRGVGGRTLIGLCSTHEDVTRCEIDSAGSSTEIQWRRVTLTRVTHVVRGGTVQVHLQVTGRPGVEAEALFDRIVLRRL